MMVVIAMARSTNKDTARHREQIVEAASELFRERGIDNVSIPEIMGAAGLTHGGFYRHFDSKEHLAAIAAAHAVHTRDAAADGGDPQAFAEGYLSPRHRDDAAHGCPVAALAVEVARTAPDSPLRKELTAGVESFAARAGGEDRDASLARMATMVGALVLARATDGDPVSDEILAAARAALAT